MSKSIKLSEIKSNPNNPRVIKDEKFQKLVKSLTEFPKMMELRPMVINEDNIVLGGNMRLKALKELGYKDIPTEWVKRANELTEDEQRRFIIADNVGFGEHDWEMLANEWDTDELSDWGLDIPDFESEESDLANNENPYTTKIETPTYEPKNEKPRHEDVLNLGRYNELMDKIKSSKVDEKTKLMLQLAATRHIVFDYSKLADFYAHSEKDVQELMEDSALVIIDYNKAIELGFVSLSEKIAEQYAEETE